MTVSELYRSVAQLGFEDTLEEDSRFFYAANRALLQISAIRPATSVYVINHQPMENKVKESAFTPIEKTDELCFEATDVKSYYFEADGEGEAYIELLIDGKWVYNGSIKLSSKRKFVPYAGFIKYENAFTNKRVRIRFVGPYLYSVRNVAMYSHIYSEDVKDIPAYEAYSRYDISTLTSDFLSLASPPIRDDGGAERLNQGYDVENGRTILLPYNDRGLYKVIYNRRPAAIVDSGDITEDLTPIDIDEDLCALMPLLIASFVWVEDEPEMAQYYLSLYRERAVEIERRLKNDTPVAMKSVNGW